MTRLSWLLEANTVSCYTVHGAALIYCRNPGIHQLSSVLLWLQQWYPRNCIAALHSIALYCITFTISVIWNKWRKISNCEQRVTRGTSLSEFDLPKLKVYKVERSVSPSIFLIKQRGQPLCLDLFILREIDWKGSVQVWHQPKSSLYLPQNSINKFLLGFWNC